MLGTMNKEELLLRDMKAFETKYGQGVKYLHPITKEPIYETKDEVIERLKYEKKLLSRSRTRL